MKPLVLLGFGIMIATVGPFAHGDDMQDPNIVGRAWAVTTMSAPM